MNELATQATENGSAVAPSLLNAGLGFIVDMELIKKMREARIEWRIGNAHGGGCWFPAAHAHELRKIALQMCVKYGAGTHWVAERDA